MSPIYFRYHLDNLMWELRNPVMRKERTNLHCLLFVKLQNIEDYSDFLNFYHPIAAKCNSSPHKLCIKNITRIIVGRYIYHFSSSVFSLFCILVTSDFPYTVAIFLPVESQSRLSTFTFFQKWSRMSNNLNWLIQNLNNILWLASW